MKYSRFFTVIISFLMFFSFINFANAGDEDMNFKLKIPSKTGHGFDSRRVEEFGWEWDESQNTYINKYTKTELDSRRFNIFGIHKDTCTRFDKNKFDWDGYYDRGMWDEYVAKQRVGNKGRNHRGFDIKTRKNIYTGTLWDKKRLDIRRFDRKGIHAHTKTKYDIKDELDGYDVNGKNFFGVTSEELEKVQAGTGSF